MEAFSSSPQYRAPSPSPAVSRAPLSTLPASTIAEAQWLQLRPAQPLPFPPSMAAAAAAAAAAAFPSGFPSLPSTASLSRSASSQLSGSAMTAMASSAAHYPLQHAALSPQQASHRFGQQLHQPQPAAPLASPVLQSLRLPPSAFPSEVSGSTASSTAASVAYSALPPFHPSAGPSAAASVSSSSSSPSSPPSSFSVQHHIPACSIGLDGCITEANAAFLSAFGFPPSLSLLPSPPSVYGIVHPAEHLSFMLMCRRITSGRVRSLAKERLCCSRDGQRVQRMWVMMSAVTLDERLLTLYCCFLPKPRREEEEEEEREREELRLELEGRAQLQQTQAELQEEMSRIERLYQQQFAALSRQQEKYGVTQQMIANYSQQQQGAAAASSSSSSAASPPQPRDPARLSLSGLPKPQQLQLHALYHTNEELKALQHQHRQKLGHFMQLLARQAPFQAALSATSVRAAAAGAGAGAGLRAHTAPSFGSAEGSAMMEDEGSGRPGGVSGDAAAAAGLSAEDAKVAGRSRSPQSALSSSSSQSQSRPPLGRVFSSSVASTSQESPSPFSSEPAPSSRSSSATLASVSSSSSSLL